MTRTQLLAGILVITTAGAAFIAVRRHDGSVVKSPTGIPPQPERTPWPPLELDLSKLPTGERTALKIPDGWDGALVLLNRAPAGLFHYSITTREGRKEFPDILPYSKTISFHPQTSGPCEPAATALLQLVKTTDEALVAARVARALEVNALHGCPALESVYRYMAESAQRITTQWIYPSPAQRVSVTIERLDPETRAVVKRWDVDIGGHPPASLTWRYPAESAWLAGSIATDLAPMILFAQSGAVLAPDAVEVTAAADRMAVVVKRSSGTRVTSRIDTGTSPLWSSSAWLPLARVLLKDGRPPAGPSSSGSTVAADLLDLRPEVIIAASRRVSADLARNLLDAAAHDRAALVLAAFAIREEAGAFSDVRPALSRMTAHLALSRALASQPTGEGELAAAALLVLSGRQKDGLDAIGRIRRDTEPWKSWKTALSLRANGDWRGIKPDLPAPFLLRREQFRALMRRTPAAAFDLVKGDQPPSGVDLTRITMALGHTVETGNLLAASGPGTELAESAAAWKAIHQRESAGPDLLKALNARPVGLLVQSGSKGPEVMVLGWGDWAASGQRHLLASLRALEEHQDQMLGLGEQAAELRSSVQAQFSILDQYPMLPMGWANRPQRAGVEGQGAMLPVLARWCRSYAGLVGSRPEVVTFGSWDETRGGCPEQRDSGTLPAVEVWFDPRIPYGTAFEAARRLRSYSAESHDFSRIDDLHAKAPFDAAVLDIFVVRKYGQPKPDQFRAAAGPVFDYDAGTLRTALQYAADDPSALSIRQRLCELDAESCFDLGAYLVAERRFDEGAVAYERGVAESLDAVTVANRIGWLLDYEWDHGRRDRAMTLARRAADTGSQAGMTTLARLLERAKRYDEAEAVLEQERERYGGDWYLNEFYFRYQRRVGDGKYARQAERATAAIFPKGLRQVTAQTIDGPPQPPAGGALVDQPSEAGRRLGLRVGDVVVAAEGWRVRNDTQWNAVLSLRDDQTETLVVLRGGKFLELSGPYPRPKHGP